MVRNRKKMMRFRLARLHARLIISAGAGLALTGALYLAGELPWSTRGLLGWNGGVILYLASTFWMMAGADIKEIRGRADIQDEGAFGLVVLTAFAAVASLAAIVAEMGEAAGGQEIPAAMNVAIGMGTIVLSWLFMHTIFALHYAHEYYGEGGDGATGGLEFPGAKGPDYWDFLYFSFVIGMTFQVSDVRILSKTIRRLVTVQAVIAFFFNVAILALMVNMAAGLIKPDS